MKKNVYFLMGILLVVLCGCGKTQDTSVDMQKATAAEYHEADHLADEFEIRSVKLPVKEENLGFYCVSDGKIFYAVDYSDSLLDQTGTGENVKFEDKYNTQIHMYDMDQGEDQLVYQYDLDDCMPIFDLRAKGDRIVWVEQPKSGGWTMKTMNIENETQPQIITDSTKISSDETDAIVPTMGEDKVYWYLCEKDKKHPYSLYSYDFLTQKIQCEQNDLDVENSKLSQLHIDGEVSAPVSNESLSVWMKNYETDGTLYTYDWDAAEIGKIDFNPGRFFSYGIIGDNVFVNQRDQSAYGSDGLICFDVKKKEYQQIMETDQMLTIFQGDDDEIYTSVVEDGVVTIITVTMRDEKSGAAYQVLDGWTEEKSDDIVYFTPDAYKVGDEASCPAYMTASGYIQKFDMSDDWGVMKDGRIEQVYTDNHSSAEVDGSIDGLCAPGYLMKVDYDLYSAAELEKEKEDGTDMAEIDQTAQYWVLYLAREEEETGYILALNTRNYTKEDMLAWAKHFIF